jgi:hypothetical protein
MTLLESTTRNVVRMSVKPLLVRSRHQVGDGSFYVPRPVVSPEDFEYTNRLNQARKLRPRRLSALSFHLRPTLVSAMPSERPGVLRGPWRVQRGSESPITVDGEAPDVLTIQLLARVTSEAVVAAKHFEVAKFTIDDAGCKGEQGLTASPTSPKSTSSNAWDGPRTTRLHTKRWIEQWDSYRVPPCVGTRTSGSCCDLCHREVHGILDRGFAALDGASEAWRTTYVDLAPLMKLGASTRERAFLSIGVEGTTRPSKDGSRGRARQWPYPMLRRASACRWSHQAGRRKP